MPFSDTFLAEGVVLLLVGFGAFFGLKGPITRLAWLPAVDRVVMATAAASMRVGSDPGRYAYRMAERLPGVDVEELLARRGADSDCCTDVSAIARIGVGNRREKTTTITMRRSGCGPPPG